MLLLTKWNMIKDLNDDNFHEIPFEDFIDILQRNMGKKEYEIRYNKNNLVFDVVFEGKSHTFSIGNDLITNYNNGLYNDFTDSIKSLVDKQNEIDLINNKNTEALEINKKIIDDANNGIIENSKAKEVYLKYLREKSKPKLSNILLYFKNLFEDYKKSFDETTDFIKKIKLPFSDVDLLSFHLVWTAFVIAAGVTSSLLGVVIGNHIPAIVITGIISTPQLIAISHSIIGQLKARTNRLTNYIKEKDSTHEKIKRIKKMKFNNEQEVIFKAKDLPKTEEKEIEKIYKNSCLNSLFFNLIELSKGLSNEDKIKYEKEIRSLYMKYNNTTDNALGYETISFNLKSEIISKIALLEIGIVDGLKREKKENSKKQFENQMEDKLRELGVTSPNDTAQSKTKSRVKQKRL